MRTLKKLKKDGLINNDDKSQSVLTFIVEVTVSKFNITTTKSPHEKREYVLYWGWENM